MSNPNQPPTSPEELTFPTHEMVQFTDHEMAMLYRQSGEHLLLGEESLQKYARDFHGTDMAILKTKSGNEYMIGGGFVINVKQGLYFELTDDAIEVTVGRPCTIKGVGNTSPVESVLLRYKAATGPHHPLAQEQVDQASPFTNVEAYIMAANMARDEADKARLYA